MNRSLKEQLDRLEQVDRRLYTANTELYPEQKAMWDKDEDQYFIYIQGPKTLQFLILGEVWSKETVRRKDPISAPLIERNRDRGFLFGRRYSGVLQDGEIATTHISLMWPISREAFLEARALHWKAMGPLCRKAIATYVNRLHQN